MNRDQQVVSTMDLRVVMPPRPPESRFRWKPLPSVCGVLRFNWYRETGRCGDASAFGFQDVQVIMPGDRVISAVPQALVRRQIPRHR
jgi:hypothetical protein